MRARVEEITNKKTMRDTEVKKIEIDGIHYVVQIELLVDNGDYYNAPYTEVLNYDCYPKPIEDHKQQVDDLVYS